MGAECGSSHGLCTKMRQVRSCHPETEVMSSEKGNYASWHNWLTAKSFRASPGPKTFVGSLFGPPAQINNDCEDRVSIPLETLGVRCFRLGPNTRWTAQNKHDMASHKKRLKSSVTEATKQPNCLSFRSVWVFLPSLSQLLASSHAEARSQAPPHANFITT